MLKLDNARIENGGFELRADFSVEPGARVAVIGPSGAGKSTLIGAIAGFHPVVAGRMYWRGEDMTDALPGERPVTTLFQDGNLFAHLSVAKNVGLGIDPNRRLRAHELDAVEAALDRVGLSGMGARKPGALSGGQQSRAALARVLVQRRALILLDEPFAALGPALKADMLDLVRELAAETGATLLFVSHDPRDAERISQSAIVVADGIAHAPEDTAKLLANPPEALRDYLG